MKTDKTKDQLVLESVLADLRHAYLQLVLRPVDGHEFKRRHFADGLIAPQIRRLEKLLKP